MNLNSLYKSFCTSFKDITDSPASDAKILICHCLGITQTQLALYGDEEVPSDKLTELEKLRTARLEGQPVAYLTGERGFYECIFKVSPDTLIPRADTETLVEEAIADITELCEEQQEVKILDLCCGTGCIGISVAKVLSDCFDKVSLTLADISEKAMKVCKLNAKDLIKEDNIEVSFVIGNLFENIKDSSFDAILSNPPYIASSVIPTLEKQVQFEPVLALDGGKDGLDFVRRIAEKAKEHLRSGGLLEMEIGYDQAEESTLILEKYGYSFVEVIQDLAGNDRVIKGRM